MKKDSKMIKRNFGCIFAAASERSELQRTFEKMQSKTTHINRVAAALCSTLFAFKSKTLHM
jgi:hypothetical protein